MTPSDHIDEVRESSPVQLQMTVQAACEIRSGCERIRKIATRIIGPGGAGQNDQVAQVSVPKQDVGCELCQSEDLIPHWLTEARDRDLRGKTPRTIWDRNRTGGGAQ